jgi:ankyrin repeat protein
MTLITMAILQFILQQVWITYKLLTSTENGDVSKVKLLLDNGSDINDQNSEGNTPLHISIAKQFTDIVKLLIQRGALVNLPNSQLQTPLHKLDELLNQNGATQSKLEVLQDLKSNLQSLEKSMYNLI